MNDITKPPNGRKGSRLALFLPSFVGGGAEKAFIRLAKGFLERGNEIDIVVVGKFGELQGQVDQRARLFDLGKKRVILALPGLVNYLRQEKPLVLLSSQTHANLIAIWAGRLAQARFPIIISEHSHLSTISRQAPGIKNRMVYTLAKLFYPWADGVIAVSAAISDDFTAHMRLTGERLRVIQNPIDLKEIERLSDESPVHDWLISGSPPVVLAAGRLHEQKDYANLINAFAKVAAQHPARLVILGEGEERKNLEDLAASLGIADLVSLPGFVKNPFACMRRCAVFTLTSPSEGLPTVLLEALACGANIVATDCPGGTREILADGALGRLVPVREPDALAGAILQALAHPLDPEKARLHAAEFDLEIIVEKYLGFFTEILRKGNGDLQ